MERITSPRLDFPPLTVEALDALMAGDRDTLEAIMGARFPEPLGAPPLMDDALSFFRKLMADATSARFGAFLLVLRETGEAVGSAGFTGAPNDRGAVLMGYSVYPEFQGRGLASEAAEALAGWALHQPDVDRVEATIRPNHVASQRVATRAGLRRTDRVEQDPDEGLVEVWERTRRDGKSNNA
jgi:ribosomal-protein-alanine N-acetyltransferase